MSVRKAILGVLSAGLVLGALAGEASAAEGVVIHPSLIPAGARATLLADIESAKTAHPSAFVAVAEVRKQLPELDAKKRGRAAPVTPMLKSIGAPGLFPMLAELAVEASARGDLTDSAWSAWRVGLLEAVGSIRDPRSEAVLTAILESPEADFAVVKAAAEALGKVGTDRAAAKLVAMSKAAGPKQKAILAGMGECRRTKTTEALAKALAARPDEETAKLVIRSLGNAGSAWAWKTPAIAVSGEEAAVRKLAAQALVDAFVAYEGEARKGASSAILVVADPSTPGLIEAAKKQKPALTSELDALAARFTKSPIR
jgi:HEAT repeat protein